MQAQIITIINESLAHFASCLDNTVLIYPFENAKFHWTYDVETGGFGESVPLRQTYGFK